MTESQTRVHVGDNSLAKAEIERKLISGKRNKLVNPIEHP